MQQHTQTADDPTDPAVATTDRSADVALSELRASARNSYWKARFGASFAIMPGVLVGPGLWFGIFSLLRPVLGDDPAALTGMIGYLVGAFGGGYVGLTAYSKRSAAEIARRAEHADVRALRPLTVLVRGNVWAGTIWLLPSLHACVAAMQRILSEVTPEDRTKIEDDGDLAGLRSILASCANHYGWIQAALFPPEFVRVALQALQTLEDRQAAHLAERLTRAIGMGRRCAEVRSIAQEALPALREVAERARERAELLRPAEDPNRPEETLLRPVEAAPTGDVELLVPPAEPSPERPC
ncbi:MAG: hypothetical protein FJX72_18860 [Armatimonadetes bacterium]|nr:hypothetical protein [Armatimonadota bacterium]